MEPKMKAFVQQIGGRQSILAIAVLAAIGPAYAQTGEMEASVSAGVGGVTGDKADRALFGQYNGLRKDDAYGLLDVYYSRRNAATGSLVEFEGLNLGLDTRELNFLWKKQGDWKFSANYGELVRYDPYTINTGLLGAGSTTPHVVHLGATGTGSDLELRTKRTSLGVAFSKWFASGLQVEASLKSEKKEGSRLFGIGMNCPSAFALGCGPTTGASAGSAVMLLPEPIDANHGQVEARLNYADGKLQLSAGYYGSFYDNSNGPMNQRVPGSLNGPLGNLLPLSTGLQSILNLPVALPPDNQAHHFDLSGNYAFTPTTRANFKLAYAQATQKQDFAGGLTGAPAGVANLDGRVDTTLAQVGISSRPLPKLTLLAEARYEDRDDKTPIAPYNQVNDAQGNPVFTFTNRNLPYTKTRGKLQATYQFTNEYQGSVGAAYEKIDRGTFTPTSAVSGISALRSETEETGFHVELRRRMTETFSGSIRLETSDRDGSNWLVPNSGLGVTEVTGPTVTFNSATAILLPTLADRRRDKAKLLASWQPAEALSLQFSAEGGEDKYKGSDQGLHSTRMNLFSVDFNYAFSDAWSLNGYASTGTQRLNQSRPAGYILAFDNTSTNFGLGVIGKPNEKIDLGAGLSFVDDKSVYAQTLDATANAGSVALLAATGGLPDIVFRSAELKLFGKYALSKESALRLDATYQRAKWNDWAYGYNGVPFRFSDNTTVTLRPEQDVTYVGVTYIYAWR